MSALTNDDMYKILRVVSEAASAGASFEVLTQAEYDKRVEDKKLDMKKFYLIKEDKPDEDKKTPGVNPVT